MLLSLPVDRHPPTEHVGLPPHQMHAQAMATQLEWGWCNSAPYQGTQCAWLSRKMAPRQFLQLLCGRGALQLPGASVPQVEYELWSNLKGAVQE